MKKINKLLLSCFCASLMLFTGCIDETEPTVGGTEDQLKGTDALIWAMPAYMNTIFHTGISSQHYDMGYGANIRIREVMGEDFTTKETGFDWFQSWANNEAMGAVYAKTDMTWRFYYKWLGTVNRMILSINPDDATATQLGYLGIGYAFRAFIYLDMARMYEFLPTEVFPGNTNEDTNNVLNLTTVIVDGEITEQEARNNPRVTREAMYSFIIDDLEKAERYITNISPRISKTLPDLSVVYGLRARLYMWVEEYGEAEKYARYAINAGSYTPLTKEQWTSTTTGFNTINDAWMWGSQQTSDDLQSNLVNWTSWMSNEAAYGYTGAGAFILADKRFYESISDNDFRKLSWKAPNSSPLYNQNTYIDLSYFENTIPTYGSLKFRPANGNMTVWSEAAATAYPLMRVEEMYLIEAEAAEHVTTGAGKTLLENFMQTHRYNSYTCPVSLKDDVIKEIIFQKRVELWGEGHVYFDYKRLNMSVTRNYMGTNHPSVRQFNTNGRPAWMNFVIGMTETQSNNAVVKFNNPDPSGLY